MITLIDRYISKNFLTYFILGLTTFATLFLIVDFMVKTSRFDVGLGVLGEYYSFYLFDILFQLIPVGCLMATIFTLSQLSSQNEMVILHSLGWSLFRVSLPILVLVTTISSLAFLVSNEFMTKVIDKKNQVYYVKMKKQPWLYSSSKNEDIWYRSGQSIYNIELLNNEEQRAFGVTLFTFSTDWKLQQIITAKEADIANGQWTLKDGYISVYYDEASPPLSETFDIRNLSLGEDMMDIKTSSKAALGMGVNELRRYIQKNKDAGLNTTSFEVDYHAKFGMALTALVMTLLGIPFATSNSRSGGLLVNFQICLVLTLIYWATYNTGLTMGKHGSVPAFWAVWTPNLVMAGFAFYLIRRQRK